MDCITALRSAGIDPADVDLNHIGAWQHLRTDDKPAKKNGRVMVFQARPLRFYFQNFATGITGHYSDGPGFLSRTDYDQVQRAKRESVIGRELNQAEIAKMAATNLGISKPADPQHGYLVSKRVGPHGIRQLGDNLVIPMGDAEGKVWSYQTINAQGEKRYLHGGRKRGHFYALLPSGRRPATSAVVFAEGFATAATLFEVLDAPVFCCFDAINLAPVSAALRPVFPEARFVFAADNDCFTDGNPGVSFATQAASKVRGVVVYPEFGLTGLKDRLTDFNDLAVRYSPALIPQFFAEVLS